jgi:AcrR family transcriptional regulator
MAQVKKESVRLSIVDSAFQLFSERGYHDTTLQQIAEGAGVGVGSVYSYFDSKLQLLYAVYEPWQEDRFRELERKIARTNSRRQKLNAILLGVWRDIPMQNIGLANSLMEALSSADPSVGKQSSLLRRTEIRLKTLLADVVPKSEAGRRNVDVLPNLILMAYDGFVINRRLNDIGDVETLAETMCDLILGCSVA